MSEDEPQDAAAEAFEALRAEVAQLRRALEGLPTTAPDYTPTLAAIAQSLAAMEAHPALRLTPDASASQVRQASGVAQQQGRRELANAVQRVDAAGADLERLAERQRTGREQVRQVVIMTAVAPSPVSSCGFVSQGRSRALSPPAGACRNGWPPRRCGWTAGRPARGLCRVRTREGGRWWLRVPSWSVRTRSPCRIVDEPCPKQGK